MDPALRHLASQGCKNHGEAGRWHPQVVPTLQSLCLSLNHMYIPNAFPYDICVLLSI